MQPDSVGSRSSVAVQPSSIAAVGATASPWFVVDWDCCLGAGGEGEVFLGRSVSTWELCAIKVSTSLDRELAAEQLRDELQRLFRASGDGVVGLVGWNLEAPRPFIVFEFAHAGTLADEMRELRRTGRVYHPTRALERIRELLLSLSNVHGRGLLHRDIKPANVLRFGDSLKLTDFGAGCSIGPSAARHNEAFVGTRMYAAPEQLSGEPIDERADLYGVGCILHEMLTGVVPQPSGRESSGSRYPHVLVLPALDELLARLLDEDKSRRPYDAADAVRHVDAALESYDNARRTWTRLGLGASPY